MNPDAASVRAMAEPAALALEFLGVGVLLAGVSVATVAFARAGLRTRRWREACEAYRANLGRGILLSLELLVGADIIATVTAPLTLESVGLLALLVGVRTFLSVSLETEIEGVFALAASGDDTCRRALTSAALWSVGYRCGSEPAGHLELRAPRYTTPGDTTALACWRGRSGGSVMQLALGAGHLGRAP